VDVFNFPEKTFPRTSPLRVFKEARPDFGPFGTECGLQLFNLVVFPAGQKIGTIFWEQTFRFVTPKGGLAVAMTINTLL
jgi:hypothetical protein